MGNITFVFFTLNEEKRIGYCIRNCIKFGQVLILDDGSTDKTRVIAEQLGARVVVRPKVEYAYGENPVFFDVVKKNINTDWVYWGYADQLLPKKLLEKLAEISGQDKIKRVFVPIYTYLWGNTQYPVSKGYTPNFFHTKYMDFSTNKIHGMGKFLGIKQEEFKLPNLEDFAIRHFSVYDLKKFIMNHMAYAETEARQKYEDGEKFSLYRLLGGMTRYFFLFSKNRLKIGYVALFSGLLYAFFRLLVSIRLYELEYGITPEGIENKFAQAKSQIIKAQE